MKRIFFQVSAPSLLAIALSACVADSTPPPTSSSSQETESNSSELNSSAINSSSSQSLSPSSESSSVASSSDQAASSSTAVNVPPAVEFSSPPEGYSFGQGNASSYVVAIANDDNLASVSLYINGELIETLNRAPWIWFNTVLQALPAGQHTLRLEAVDTEGEVAWSERSIRAIQAPNFIPTVTITAPSEGALLQNGSSIDVTAEAEDSDGEIKHVTLYINDQVVAVDDTAPYSWPSSVLTSLQNLGTGNYTLKAIAEDNNGGTSDDSVSFEIAGSNDFPVVSFVMPSNNLSLPVGSSLDVAANAEDSDGSVVEVRFYLNDVLVGSDRFSPYKFYAENFDTLENLASGTYKLTAEAEDDKGGISRSEMSVSVDVNAEIGAGDPARGEYQYLDHCLDCHGQFGEGYDNAPSLSPLKNTYGGQTLADYISDNMPNNFETNCKDQCARNVATYMQQSIETEYAAFSAYIGDPNIGIQEYAEHCAECHGTKGLGSEFGDTLFPLRDDRSYSFSTFYYNTNSASLFSLIDLDMPVGANGFPDGHSQVCEGQCVADVIAHLEDVESGLSDDEWLDIQIARGQRWYQQQCSGCHDNDGTSRGIIPLTNAQRNNDSLDNNDPLYTENRYGMPPGNVDSCGDDCARDVTVYIREVLDR